MNTVCVCVVNMCADSYTDYVRRTNKEFDDYDESKHNILIYADKLQREFVFFSEAKLYFIRYYLFNVESISKSATVFYVVDYLRGVKYGFKIKHPLEIDSYERCYSAKEYFIEFLFSWRCLDKAYYDSDRYIGEVKGVVKHFVKILECLASYSPSINDDIHNLAYIRDLGYKICFSTKVYACLSLITTLLDLFRERAAYERMLFDKSGGCTSKVTSCVGRCLWYWAAEDIYGEHRKYMF